MTKLIAIPEGHVTKNFKMDPATDTVIWGDEVVEGMVILIEDHMSREDETRIENAEEHELKYIRPRYDQNNRWCRVVSVRVINQNQELLGFLGEYSDGQIAARTFNKSYAWIVKIESL